MHDWRDWLGGYPYQASSKEEVASFLENLGFHLINFKKPLVGFGNNHYLFRRE